MAELGTIERAYADGYAAAQHEIDRLRAALKEVRHFFLGHFDDSCEECRRGDAVIREALGLKE